MTFLAPLMLVGALAVAVPVFAHLLGRTPPRVVRFAALRFLTADRTYTAKRRHVRDPWLLALRVLALLALVAFFARPAAPTATRLAVLGEPHEAVILVDGSRSMGLVVDGKRLIDHGLARVQEVIEALPSGSRVALVTTDPRGPRLELGAEPSAVTGALVAWLELGAPSDGAMPLASGLAGAQDLLAKVPPEQPAAIYAVGDQTAGGLATLPPSAGDKRPVFGISALEDPARAGLVAHVALVAAAWQAAPEVDPSAVRVSAEVKAYGATDPNTAQEVTAALELEGQEVARTAVTLLGDRATPIEFTHVLKDEGRPIRATVRLLTQGDALTSDDTRPLWLWTRESLDVLIVNGDPSELRIHDEAFFLSTALLADEDASTRLRTITADVLETRLTGTPEGSSPGGALLTDVDVLVLANVPALSEAAAQAIDGRVKEGMGLFVTAGERVAPDAYNERMSDLLPLLLRKTAVADTVLSTKDRAAVTFAAPAVQHPAFAEQSGDLGLEAAKVRSMLLLEPDEKRPHAVALSYSNGAPALVTASRGRGRLGLLTTSIDRDGSDLPLRPGFVPFVKAVIAFLGQSGGALQGHEVLVGQSVTLGEEGDGTAKRAAFVDTPQGDRLTVPPVQEGLPAFTETHVPGHYRVEMADGSRPHPEVFAVQVDSVESDLREVAPEATAASPEAAAVTPATRPYGREVLFFALVVLLVEALARLARLARLGRGGLRPSRLLRRTARS